MEAQKGARKRRPAQAARRQVILCAERLLVTGGVAAVQMRSVAREAGMTDAGVAHHFGNREGLLTALLDHGAAKVRSGVDQAVEEWLDQRPNLPQLFDRLYDLYASGYSALALELHRSGWRDTGPPLLEPVAMRLISQNRNPETSEEDIRAALASLHMVLALGPLFGAPFGQSAGLKGGSIIPTQKRWWVTAMTRMLSAEEPGDPPKNAQRTKT